MHGDDFTFSGTQVELEKMRGLFKKWYDVKDRGITGSGTGDVKEGVILGRTLKFTEMGLEYISDGEHRDTILKDLGMELNPSRWGARPWEAGDEDELPMEDVSIFWSVAARSNYLGPVRRDGAVRVDVEADPKVVEAAEAVGEVACGKGGHFVGVQGGRLDGYDRRVCGRRLGRAAYYTSASGSATPDLGNRIHPALELQWM